MIKCPHNEIELMSGMLNGSKKINDMIKEKGEEEVQKKMGDIIDSLAPKEATNATQACALHHGITVDQLINSPNYDKLKEEYAEAMINKVISKLETDLGLESKEAWAFILAAKGMI